MGRINPAASLTLQHGVWAASQYFNNQYTNNWVEDCHMSHAEVVTRKVQGKQKEVDYNYDLLPPGNLWSFSTDEIQ